MSNTNSIFLLCRQPTSNKKIWRHFSSIDCDIFIRKAEQTDWQESFECGLSNKSFCDRHIELRLSHALRQMHPQETVLAQHVSRAIFWEALAPIHRSSAALEFGVLRS